MKIVIDIDEDYYEFMKKHHKLYECTKIDRAILNGTPLPKALKEKPCADCVSRDLVINYLLSEWNHELKDIINGIRELPSVTHAPRIGRWEKAFDEYSYWYRCSCCGNKIPKNEWGTDYFSPYCPECSAKMEVDDEDNN